MRYLIIPVLAAVSTVLSAAPAHADIGDQLYELLADDGAIGNWFGFSVAISGATDLIRTAPTGTARMHQTTRASNGTVVGSVFVYP